MTRSTLGTDTNSGFWLAEHKGPTGNSLQSPEIPQLAEKMPTEHVVDYVKEV